jgi:pSer/pThr/pTyr-binding forkhead associated (FHA) protein
MQVKLKVLLGTSAGKEIKVAQPEFLIGREEGCHLRPHSDTVSRKHCVIRVADSQVSIEDLGSRNGVFVNGRKILEAQSLKAGDKLQIGKLQFELVVDVPIGAGKRPAVKDIKEAAVRTTSDSGMVDTDISDWLSEADEVERARRLTDPDTRQFRLDETDRIALEKSAEEADAQAKESSDSGEKKKKPEKKEPGKLPPRPSQSSKDSRDAAAESLKKFFNRR